MQTSKLLFKIFSIGRFQLTIARTMTTPFQPTTIGRSLHDQL